MTNIRQFIEKYIKYDWNSFPKSEQFYNHVEQELLSAIEKDRLSDGWTDEDMKDAYRCGFMKLDDELNSNKWLNEYKENRVFPVKNIKL